MCCDNNKQDLLHDPEQHWEGYEGAEVVASDSYLAGEIGATGVASISRPRRPISPIPCPATKPFVGMGRPSSAQMCLYLHCTTFHDNVEYLPSCIPYVGFMLCLSSSCIDSLKSLQLTSYLAKFTPRETQLHLPSYLDPRGIAESI